MSNSQQQFSLTIPEMDLNSPAFTTPAVEAPVPSNSSLISTLDAKITNITSRIDGILSENGLNDAPETTQAQ